MAKNSTFISSTLKDDIANFANDHMNRVMVATEKKLEMLIENNDEVMSAYDQEIEELERKIDIELKEYNEILDAIAKTNAEKIKYDRNFKRIVNVEMPKCEVKANKYEVAESQLSNMSEDDKMYKKTKAQAEKYKPYFEKSKDLSKESDKMWDLVIEKEKEILELKELVETMKVNNLTPKQRVESIYARRLRSLREMRDKFERITVIGNESDKDDICEKIVSEEYVGRMANTLIRSLKKATNGQYNFLDPLQKEELFDAVKEKMERNNYDKIELPVTVLNAIKDTKKVGRDEYEVFNLASVDKTIFAASAIAYIRKSFESNVTDVIGKLTDKWKNTVPLIQENEEGEDFNAAEVKHTNNFEPETNTVKQYVRHTKNYVGPSAFHDYFFKNIEKITKVLYDCFKKILPEDSRYHSLDEKTCRVKLERELKGIISRVGDDLKIGRKISETALANIIASAVGGNKYDKYKDEMAEIISALLNIYWIEYLKEENDYDEDHPYYLESEEMQRYWDTLIDRQEKSKARIRMAKAGKHPSLRFASADRERFRYNEILDTFNKMNAVLKNKKANYDPAKGTKMYFLDGFNTNSLVRGASFGYQGFSRNEILDDVEKLQKAMKRAKLKEQIFGKPRLAKEALNKKR